MIQVQMRRLRVARELEVFNRWRRGKTDKMPAPHVIGRAIDSAVAMLRVEVGMSAIAQSIRDAALSWPLGFFGDVESAIVNYAFSDHLEAALRMLAGNASVHARTYYLLVAEALE